MRPTTRAKSCSAKAGLTAEHKQQAIGKGPGAVRAKWVRYAKSSLTEGCTKCTLRLKHRWLTVCSGCHS
eukprot:12926750-Prorocentrum_lima.AAC.1